MNLFSGSSRFYKSLRIGKISKPAGPGGPLGFKTLPFLGRLQNLLLPLYFRGNVSMQTLFGRFPHLVEDIFGLLNGTSLSKCRQINMIWNENLEEYRLCLVKKIQKHLKNQNSLQLQIAFPPFRSGQCTMKGLLWLKNCPCHFWNSV